MARFEKNAEQEGDCAADEDVVGPGDGGPPGWHEEAEIPLGGCQLECKEGQGIDGGDFDFS